MQKYKPDWDVSTQSHICDVIAAKCGSTKYFSEGGEFPCNFVTYCHYVVEISIHFDTTEILL